MNIYFKILLQILGYLLVLIGLLGLFLPFLQGIIILVLGIYVLSFSSPSFKRWFDNHLSRFPRIKHHIDRQHERLMRMFNKNK